MSESDPSVISGCGWVTPFAVGSIKSVLDAAATGAPACPDRGAFRSIPDSMVDEHTDLGREVKRDRAAALTAMAMDQAMRGAGLTWASVVPERTGLVVGSAMAGQTGMIDFAGDVRAQGARFVSPLRFPQTVGNYLAGAMARAHNLRGPNVTLAGGEGSSIHAIQEGCGELADGAADVMLVGGTEVLTDELVAGFAAPASQFSEGACWFVLERASAVLGRGAAPLATVQTRGAPQAPNPKAPDIHASTDPVEGAVFIAHWIGRCLGAAGACATAAAIGAANGCPVPVVASGPGAQVSIRAVSLRAPTSASDELRAVVTADSPGGATLGLRLTIAPGLQYFR